ncbi:caspase recruitment domain-containing protein 8-like [Embiotoca jacksoni]|uniref:caspase recruitment domain-containing protein 8-like n=1 Tax=Embiotoca jacksoni TaxID=100190 RepID=UPI0037041D3B
MSKKKLHRQPEFSREPDRIREPWYPQTPHAEKVNTPSIPTESDVIDLTLTEDDTDDTLLEEFSPDITDDFDDEIYSFQSCQPGRYRCSVTGLVFHMKAEGEVKYRMVPWNSQLLTRQHKKPAGPLFDIKCVSQSLCGLQLPHCEICSMSRFLSVAHVNEDGVEFIEPRQITETHVIIDITGLSAFGNVRDQDAPPAPVHALVLLFYQPPRHYSARSLLNVLLLPRNIVIRDVQRTRRKLNGDELYIDSPPYCKLQPQQLYTLSTDHMVKVQPTETEFDEEMQNSCFTSFQVILKTIITDINLSVKKKDVSRCVWEGEVCLPTRKNPSNKPPKATLLNIRSSFIESASGPVLSSLLDKLLEEEVLTESEREGLEGIQSREGKARSVIDAVRKKGEDASSKMVNFLHQIDPFICKHLGLI